MSIQPRRPLLDALREVLRKMEADADADTPNLAELKRILRERIAAIEANGGIANLQPFSSAQETLRKTFHKEERRL